jgi:hypothetical protein
MEIFHFHYCAWQFLVLGELCCQNFPRFLNWLTILPLRISHMNYSKELFPFVPFAPYVMFERIQLCYRQFWLGPWRTTPTGVPRAKDT